MATPGSVEFNSDAVVAFIIENGGKATTAEVARHFRKFLLDEDNQEKNKALFREYVNAVAVIKRVENEKVLVLKPSYERSELSGVSDSTRSTPTRSLGGSIESIPTDDPRSLQELSQSENRQTIRTTAESSAGSSDSLTTTRDNTENLKETEYAETSDHHIITPVAPPRRKHSMKEKKPAVLVPSKELDSAKVSNAGGDKESEPKISVKEQAQKINKFVSDTQLALRPHNANTKKAYRETPYDKNADDDDRASVISVGPTTKEWMVVAAKADYHAMIKLLRDEPKLAKYKHFKTFMKANRFMVNKHTFFDFKWGGRSKDGLLICEPGWHHWIDPYTGWSSCSPRKASSASTKSPPSIDSNQSIRWIDIVAFEPNTNHAYLIDPMVRYETNQDMAKVVQEEKTCIYEACILELSTRYEPTFGLRQYEIFGLWMRARGEISNQVVEFFDRFGLDKTTLPKMTESIISNSVKMIHYHI